MKILEMEITGTQTSLPTKFGSKLSFILCFLFPDPAATYIFTSATYTNTIITVELCALNAKFQHFILGFNKISLLCGYR
jgi:hypothetical protein